MSETLDQTLQRKAEELSHDDLVIIIAGLREQRSRWNLEQSKGSRKRTPSTKIKTTKKKGPALAASALKKAVL